MLGVQAFEQGQLIEVLQLCQAVALQPQRLDPRVLPEAGLDALPTLEDERKCQRFARYVLGRAMVCSGVAY